MAINFPTSLDTLTNPAGDDTLDSPSHSTQHSDANDAVEALEAKVGVSSSAVMTSLDFLLKANPEGHLINGKIVPSVASDNLTVALKGLDGNDPSATNPIYVRIGDTVHSITSALSVTKAAGTNWCNAGSSELATKEIDYFVYLGYNATDGVVIGFARIPYATDYSQFSATTTNDKYCAISTTTNAASGDDYTVIGRFAATLSAGAGYTWTVPTFTSINLIQRPIFESRKLSYVPALTGFSSNPATIQADYLIRNYQVFVRIYTHADGTSNATTYTMTAPFTNGDATYNSQMYGSQGRDNTAAVNYAPFVRIRNNSNIMDLYKDNAATSWTNSGAKRVVYVGGYFYLT